MSPRVAAVARVLWPWPALLGVASAVIFGVWSTSVVAGLLVGLGVAGAVISVQAVRRTSPSAIGDKIDPFTVGEPWRQYVQSAIGSQRRFQRQVEATPPGPISDYLIRVSSDLDQAMADIWSIAQAGNRTTAAIRELDPTRLRSKLDRLQVEDRSDDDPNLDDSIRSMQSQLASVERLEEQSADTASRLRLDVTRLDELVSNTVLVTNGELPQQRYDSDLSELVRSLQALHSATEDLRSS